MFTIWYERTPVDDTYIHRSTKTRHVVLLLMSYSILTALSILNKAGHNLGKSSTAIQQVNRMISICQDAPRPI
jgi:hypothetical protein